MMFGPGDRRLETALMLTAFALFVAVTYFGYIPPYQHYLPMLAKARDPALFPLDIHMQNSTYMRASIFYPFLHLTQLRIENDAIGFSLHVVLNSLLFALAVAAIRHRLANGDRVLALLAGLVSCFFYTKLVEGSRATPLSFITPTPTGIGHILGMAALFVAMLRRPALAAILATLCVAVAPKGNILIVPALGLWMLLDKSLPRRAVLWIMLPLGYIGYMAATTTTSIPADQKHSMLKMLIIREEEDGLFTYQPLLTNILLPAGLVFAGWLARRTADPTVRALLWSLIVVTGGGWLAMLVYPFGLDRMFPVPLLIMLSVPQATKYFIWLALTAGLVLALRESRLAWYEKVGVVLALVALRPFPLHAALATGIGGAVVLSAWWRHRRAVAPSGRISPALAVPLILMAFLATRIGNTYVGPAWIDKVGFTHYGSWSTLVFADDDTWRAWKSLQPLPDFQFLSIYRDHPGKIGNYSDGTPRLSFHPAANVAAAKSQFWSVSVHGYNDPPLMKEIMLRTEVVYEMVRRLEAGRTLDGFRMGTVHSKKEGVDLEINQTVVDFLVQRKMILMIPGDLDHLFPAGLPRRPVGGQILIGFGLVP
ncbi:hypothetical protein [Magnetospirillum sp. SS-4]|uniref:hypothetical protein n=1 Tax=Magnetospirillum sp. SS-4 TaxID=2681465 RepID=UPI0013815F16|nr:hypothetical protein [Magnetospirillum sp. SS-4]CAA7621345.1 conserved membrane hypothetical protein [Magnetospirillum sp. SS-4]